jgi:hypothetical protein
MRTEMEIGHRGGHDYDARRHKILPMRSRSLLFVATACLVAACTSPRASAPRVQSETAGRSPRAPPVEQAHAR